MPLRLILDATAAAAGILAVMLASLQVERSELPPYVVWLAILMVAIAATSETVELIELMDRARQ